MWLSLVERYVRDVEVAGSNPVTPIFPWKYGLFWKLVFFCCHFFTEDLDVGKIFWLEKRECAKDWKRGRSNKVPTKFKIMYARGFLKGVWGRSGENTVWNIWTWFKGEIERMERVPTVGWGLGPLCEWKRASFKCFKCFNFFWYKKMSVLKWIQAFLFFKVYF